MNRQPNSFPRLTETNGKSPYSPFQNPASTSTEEEKWDLAWLGAIIRRRGLLMVQVALGTTLLGGGLLFLMTKSTSPRYAGQFQLLVEPVTAEEQLARSSTRAQGSDVDVQRINIEQSSLDYESQIRILQSPTLLYPVVSEVRQRYPDTSYETLVKNLNIARITTLSLDKKEQGTKLIEVRYEDNNPEKVKFILDRLSQTYLKYSLQERQSKIQRGLQFIDSQLPPLRQRVDSLQQQIQALSQRYNIADPEQQGKQLIATTGKLNEAEAENQTQVAEAEAKRNSLVRQLNNANLQSVLANTTYYQALLNQYQQLEGLIAVESARLQPENPTMQDLLQKRRNLKSLLNQEANLVIKTTTDSITVAQARRQAINQAQAQVNQKIQQLSAIARQYKDLQSKLALASDSFNKFASRREALQIDAAQQEIPWELTIPPRLELDESGQAIQVNNISKVRFLALIAVLAVLLGVGVGFLIETMQDLLHTKEEVKQAIKLPLLGAIPHNHSQLPVLSDPVTQAFQSLSKNLRLLSKTYSPIRSLMITSPEVGDGKSTIAVHLAMTAAAMGQRVLLVDADLRHPKIHELLGLSNHQGLSHLLENSQDIQSVLQSSSASANLMVLTAGEPSLDPVELFTNNRVEVLFQKLQAMFDLLIVDTPPLLGSADTGLVAAHCDSLAVVVRLGKTSRQSVLAALEELKFSSISVLGVITNDGRETLSLPQGYYGVTDKPKIKKR
ncbi:polysaccharide biosynthesis tyrosine autokinase [Desmonostoc muscorum LEGE 12446]|uniref:Polysaccharide biosynthesis tyrosine autokinase n=1 Tax=Desmonostoc muscorum LEGE 12446 TaxID=1828758 RepID=A0A8J6ZTN5_DESMC|nr:tyrosine-protein kinase domain-containing protein [Desmonostoc muscorum]MCF2146319.1 polysaccharide biosynthesis tyrosine autokinase [Desmonostoc muscorum LEGE 12446]